MGQMRSDPAARRPAWQVASTRSIPDCCRASVRVDASGTDSPERTHPDIPNVGALDVVPEPR
jgi:hypothetical protein